MVHEELARARAELARERDERAFQAAVYRVLLRPTSTDRRLRELMGLLVPRLGDWCVIDRLQRHERTRRVVLHGGACESGELAWIERARGGLDPLWKAIRVARTGPSRLYGLTTGGQLSPGLSIEARKLLQRLGNTSALIVPMEAEGTRLGAITLLAGETRPSFDRAAVGLMEEIAALAAAALLSPGDRGGRRGPGAAGGGDRRRHGSAGCRG